MDFAYCHLHCLCLGFATFQTLPFKGLGLTLSGLGVCLKLAFKALGFRLSTSSAFYGSGLARFRVLGLPRNEASERKTEQEHAALACVFCSVALGMRDYQSSGALTKPPNERLQAFEVGILAAQ